MKKLLRNLVFFLSLFITIPSFSQIVIKGEVVDGTSGEALIGASVYVPETEEGTITDFDGSFELRLKGTLPVKITFSFTGFEDQILEITNGNEKLKIKMTETAITTTTVEVVGQRVSEKQKASPLTVESLDLLAIKQTPSENFYDGLGALKGVDITAASLGFKVINMRGFNSTSPVRSLQIIDGVDNQAPGLNFSLGNFLGSSELDVLGVELVQGASSAFYGPNAFNGVISMTTKSPFFQKGLSASIKTGERQLYQGAFRWADAVKNKNGQEFFGYKINFQYFQADDWVANNYEPVDGSDHDRTNPGRYDAVNIYGDEPYPANVSVDTALWNTPGLGTWYRSGYKEEDLVDYDSKNMKIGAALHFRLNPSKEFNSPELIFSSNYGSGTTVYQGDNRFSLKNIQFYQNRLELRKQDTYFLRFYATMDDAGDSYDPYATALKLQQLSKSDIDWSDDYRFYWKSAVSNNNNARLVDLGYPDWGSTPLIFDPATGLFRFQNQDSLTAASYEWLNMFSDSLAAWHLEAAEFANLANSTISETKDYFAPGSERFNQEFKRLISTKSNSENGGTLFYDKSALYHAQGEYKFKPGFVEHLTFGGSARLYTPKSDGTIFYDTSGVKITNFEFGAYLGTEKTFIDEKLRFSGTFRTDKNQNFDFVYTPAVSVVYKPKANNYLRVSFSSAVRNPTLTDQYLYLNVGRAILAGNLKGAQNLVTLESFNEYRSNFLNINLLEYFDIDPIKPEKVKTFEVGYRTTLFSSLYLDAGYYYNVYTDFLGFKLGLDLSFVPNSSVPDRIQAYRYAANSSEKVTSQGFSIGASYYFGDYYQLSGNYSWNNLLTETDDPIVPAFNTPEHKVNFGLSGRDIPLSFGNFKVRKTGFNINYKWVEGFLFEGSPQFTGFIDSYGLLDAQVNVNIDKWKTTIKLGASNIIDNIHFETYGGPRLGRLAYLQVLYEWNKKL